MSYIRRRASKRNGVRYCLVDGDITRTLDARTLKEAEEYLKEYDWQKAAHKPISLLLKDVTFNELAKEYLEYAKVSKTLTTYERDRSVINHLCQDIGNLRLCQIDATAIEKIQNKWRTIGNTNGNGKGRGKGKGKPNSNKTINQKSTLLGTMLRYAIQKKYLAELPKINKFKVDKRPPIWYTEEEMKLIVENADPFIRDYVLVLLNTGMRAGELRELKWEDVDFDKRFLCLQKTKSHTYRNIPMNETLFNLLTELYQKKTQEQIYVFEYFEGKPVNDFYHNFKELLKKLGIEGHVHKIRHTTATYLANNPEVSIYAVKELLGHASVTTTERYAHIRIENVKKSVDKLPSFNTQNTDGQTTVKSENPIFRIA